MHRVSRIDLESLVVVALATAPALIKSKLRSRLPHEADEARDALARSICDKIDNDAYMVIVTEMIAKTTPTRAGATGVSTSPCRRSCLRRRGRPRNDWYLPALQNV